MGFRWGNRMLGVVLASACAALSAGSSHDPVRLSLKSASALVLDQSTGLALVETQAGASVPIASLTKLMTAMVLLDARLDPQEMLTITGEDLDLLRHSRSRLPVGTRLPREQALLLALLASENRAAHALGRTFPGGLAAFVLAMNAKAKELGLTGARFGQAPLGALVDLKAGLRPEAALFSESQSRALFAVKPSQAAAFEALARRHGVPLEELGQTGGNRLCLGLGGKIIFDLELEALDRAWRTPLL